MTIVSPPTPLAPPDVHSSFGRPNADGLLLRCDVGEARQHFLLRVTIILLSVAYLLWMEGVCKDWLFSTTDPFPYAASLVTTFAVAGGLVILLTARDAEFWRNFFLWIPLVLTVADCLHMTPAKLGIFPVVPVLACAFGTASFLTVSSRPSSRWDRLYAFGVAASGALALCIGGTRGNKLTTSLSVVVITTVVTALAIWIGKGDLQDPFPQLRRPLPVCVMCGLIVISFMVVTCVTMLPVRWLHVSDAWLLGLGFESQYRSKLPRSEVTKFLLPVLASVLVYARGWLSRKVLCRFLQRVDSTNPFFPTLVQLALPLALLLLFVQRSNISSQTSRGDPAALGSTIAGEYGALTLVFLVLSLCLAVATALVLLRLGARDMESPAYPHRLTLCAGAIGSLFGALFCSQIAHPFMTGDSLMGTVMLALATASVPISSRCLHGFSEPDRSKTRSGRSGKSRRLSILGLTAMLVASGLGMTYEHQQIKALIEPYATENLETRLGSPYTPVSEISPLVKQAIIAAEDPDFYSHHGLDWKNMHKALRLDVREGHIVAGGSTITQQLVKTVFLHRDRTLRRKIKEAVLTFEVERALPKQRILEWYLNAIDFGMDQHGIREAAGFYFGKAPSQLSLSESALLAGLVSRAPHRLDLHQLAVRRRFVLDCMKRVWPARFSDSELDRATAIPVAVLLRPALVEKAEVPLANDAYAAGQEYYKRAGYWRSKGLLINLGICFGCGIAILFGKRATGRSSVAGGVSRGLLIQFLAWSALCSVFACTALHWSHLNRERLFYTVLYPYRYSPNYDSRPAGSTVNCIVLHATAQQAMWSALNEFQNPQTMRSAHFVVGKQGEIFQMVPVEQRAWHAGPSELDGLQSVNSYSVGIELVNLNNGADTYSDLQYESLARLISQLQERYAIPESRIVSHAQVALPHGRSSDPKGFDFAKLLTLVHSQSRVRSTGMSKR